MIELDTAVDYDYYTIEMRDGVKTFVYEGFIWYDTENYDQCTWRDEALVNTGRYPEGDRAFPVSELSKYRLDLAFGLCEHYITVEEGVTSLGEPLYDHMDPHDILRGRTELSYSEVNEDTPCGAYYCVYGE